MSQVPKLRCNCVPRVSEDIVEVHALKSYIIGTPNGDEVKKFLREACEVSDYDAKVYTNCNGAVAVVCQRYFNGPMDIEIFTDDKVIVVVKYKDGHHDIFMMPSNMYAFIFKEIEDTESKGEN